MKLRNIERNFVFSNFAVGHVQSSSWLPSVCQHRLLSLNFKSALPAARDFRIQKKNGICGFSRDFKGFFHLSKDGQDRDPAFFPS